MKKACSKYAVDGPLHINDGFTMLTKSTVDSRYLEVEGTL